MDDLYRRPMLLEIFGDDAAMTMFWRIFAAQETGVEQDFAVEDSFDFAFAD